MMRQTVHPSTYQDEDASPTRQRITSPPAMSISTHFSLQQAYNPAFITREFPSNSSSLEATAIRAGYQGVYIFPEWTFGVLSVSRANCTNEWREPTYGTAFSNERKEEERSIGIFRFYLCLLSLSYISSFLSIMHKQILLRENQRMNLGPLEESLHLTLCLTLSHSSHKPTCGT
jgi:hypothetical protein